MTMSLKCYIEVCTVIVLFNTEATDICIWGAYVPLKCDEQYIVNTC